MSVAIKPLQTQRDSMIDTESLSTSFMNTTINPQSANASKQKKQA